MLKKTSEFFGVSIALTALLSFVFFALLFGPLVTWILFNYLAPIFNFRQIHFTEAIALYILTNFLTGGFWKNCKCNGK